MHVIRVLSEESLDDGRNSFDVMTEQGRKTVEENELLSAANGLAALCEFKGERNTSKTIFGRKEPLNVSKGPVAGDHIAVLLKGK